MNPQSIRLRTVLWLGIMAMLGFTIDAQARVTCTVSSAGFATAYPMTGGALNITASNFTVTCNLTGRRTLTATVTYQLGVNNGVNAVGIQNRARTGASRLNYDLYSDLGCANQWQNTSVGNRIPSPSVSVSLVRGIPDIRTFSYYGCVPAGLTVPAAGTYTDTVTMTFTGSVSTGTSTFTGGTFPVSITAPATCSFSTPPGNLNFTYAAFSPTVINANTSFSQTCTTNLPYTLALDATVDVVSGLNYTLALNTTANSGGLNQLTRVGAGIPQTFFINGSMAAGQAGTCNTTATHCTGTRIRTLTITY